MNVQRSVADLTSPQPLRVLLASDHYPPYIGGAQRQVQLLAHELSRRGHEMSVATVWQRHLPSHEQEDAVEVHRLRQIRSGFARFGRRLHQPPFADPITVLELRRLIRRTRPDLVHAYGWFAYSCAAALTGGGIPLVISVRDYGYSCATRTLLHDGKACTGPALGKCLACAGRNYGQPKGSATVVGMRLCRPLLSRKVEGVHSVSGYVRDMLRRDFLPNGATSAAREARALPHVVVPSFRREDEPLRGDDPTLAPYITQLPEDPYMLFVGALRLVKGLRELMAAYERLSHPPKLVLIGTREADTPSSFPPGVHVLHDFPHAAVMVAWDRCLFGVVPSLLPEPLGSVVYEAMSRGKAVIGSVPGGHGDMIVHGDTGHLVPAGEVRALADAMQGLIDDPAERERMGRAASLRARHFTADAAIPRMEALYRDVVDRARAVARRR